MYRYLMWIGSWGVSNRATPHTSLCRFVIAALLTLLGTAAAHARTDYCVGTVAELETALSAAENDADASQITLRTGSYVLSRDLSYSQFSLEEGTLTFRGGGIGNCTLATAGADGTTIAGLFALSFQQGEGDIRIEDLSFVGLKVSVRTRPNTSDQVDINRVLMLSSYLEINAASSEVIIRDSVFRNGNNQFSIADFGLWLDVSQGNATDPEGIVQLINVSMVNAFTRISGTNRVRSVGVVNSIFQRSGVELESTANLSVRTTRTDNIQMLNAATLNSSNVITANADLNAQFQPISGSPMLDRGLSALFNGVPLFDVYGEARVVGASLDIGGAESPVDGNGVVVVTTSASSGAGSLTAAVDFANADPAPNTIRFNIPGLSCPRRIARSSALNITDGVVIDGYSQPGSVLPSSSSEFTGEPCILLDAGDGQLTLRGITTGSALTTNNESLTIKGLAFAGFANAIFLTEGSNHVLQGNQFGGSIGHSNVLLGRNGGAIVLRDGGSSLIGGLSAVQGNLIVSGPPGSGSAGSGSGITILSNDNAVVGNQIGYDNSGAPGRGHEFGINLNGGNNLIVNNRIGGNRFDGITILSESATGNEVSNNVLGGRFSVPGNGHAGIAVAVGGYNNQLGPDNEIVGNAAGIEIDIDANGRNRITRNSIAFNTGLGIDIADPGVTLNDNDSADCDLATGCPSNNDQNYPKLTSAAYQPAIFPLPSSLRVSGALRSVVGDEPYRVEFYESSSCDGSGFGEGSSFLGATDVTISNNGACTANNCSKSFTGFIQPAGALPGDYITAITIAANGDSSEFSACVQVTARFDVIFVDGFD